ncbi:hypothetical protein L6164_037226 [Bauhinia variegata]|uniref:Uncharacterized protein n=1 Tax=Bauhinia variegata TaxID=167791 RepID=A0ACB9KJL4_BAUVA|nr:hypothetical protein L6164_037226 [Bauhinia variegata]
MVELSTGTSSNKFYYDVKFPNGHIALKNFNGEIVNEEGNSVPLYEAYLHHWVLAKYHQPINSTSIDDIVPVRNAGVCQGNVLLQYFGLGAETRKTDKYIPDPFGIEIGNPKEILVGYEEKWAINLHVIDTRGVEDRWGCIECRMGGLFVPHYQNMGKEAGNEEGYIVGMTACYPQPGSVKIMDGETLTMVFNYSNSKSHTGLMGLFHFMVVEQLSFFPTVMEAQAI